MPIFKVGTSGVGGADTLGGLGGGGSVPPPSIPDVPTPEIEVVQFQYQPPDAVLNGFIGASGRIIRFADIFENDGVTPWKRGVSVVDGQVTVDYGRAERRMIDLSVHDPDNELAAYPDGFWWDKIIKVYRGVTVRLSSYLTQEWITPLGWFRVDSINRPHFPSVVAITGRDDTKTLINSKLAVATSFPEGTLVHEIIRTLAINGGVHPNRILLQSVSKTLNSVATFDADSSRWDAIAGLSEAYSIEVFFDAFGTLIVRNFRDPSLSPLSYTFETGSRGTLVGYSKSANDSRIYNRVVVRGMTSDEVPFYAEARNENPESPTSIGRIGERYLPVESALVATEAQAQELANGYLSIGALDSWEISMESLVLPWLDVGLIAGFNDPDPSPTQPSRFLLTNLTIPLGLAAMQVETKRVQLVTA